VSGFGFPCSATFDSFGVDGIRVCSISYLEEYIRLKFRIERFLLVWVLQFVLPFAPVLILFAVVHCRIEKESANESTGPPYTGEEPETCARS
jgi:hypothetical protein